MITLAADFLRGSYCPLVTPIATDDAIDYQTYARLVEDQVEAGTHGIVVNGTTAEPSLLTISERKRLLELALSVTAGRFPVVAATGSQSFQETVELSEHAEKVGANALLVVTPYYVRPSQRGLAAYYTALAERISLPFLVYHIPGRAAVSVTVETLLRIAASAPNLVGVKHAHNDLGIVTEMLAAFGSDFRILAGLEELSFPMLALGASGMVSAVSNIAPGKTAELYVAVQNGDLARARRLHMELFALSRAVFYDTNPVPIKYMAKRLGLLSSDHHRLPLLSPTPDAGRQLDRVLEDSGFLSASRRDAAASASLTDAL